MPRKNQIIEVRVDMERNMSAAKGIRLHVRKPNGQEDEWDATVYSNPTFITYTTKAGDLPVAGQYRVRPLYGENGLRIHAMVTFTVDVF